MWCVTAPVALYWEAREEWVAGYLGVGYPVARVRPRDPLPTGTLLVPLSTWGWGPGREDWPVAGAGLPPRR